MLEWLSHCTCRSTVPGTAGGGSEPPARENTTFDAPGDPERFEGGAPTAGGDLRCAGRLAPGAVAERPDDPISLAVAVYVRAGLRNHVRRHRLRVETQNPSAGGDTARSTAGPGCRSRRQCYIGPFA